MVNGFEARLPSEAEWEYGCRAGTTTPFWFGDLLTTELANYDGDTPYNDGEKGEYRKTTVPVKRFQRNPWGLYQMHGNIWEWCEDRWHDSYDDAPIDGRPWRDGSEEGRVLRGGSWVRDGGPLRSAYRFHLPPDYRHDYFGFRLARGPQGQETSRAR
jgi:formylglycine-generating enzyme required for sulfatase activity